MQGIKTSFSKAVDFVLQNSSSLTFSYTRAVVIGSLRTSGFLQRCTAPII